MKEYTISFGKKTASRAPSSTLHFEGWTRYFRHRYSIKLSKNKMDSNSNWILNSNQDLTLFRQKQILRSNIYENLQKWEQWRFIYLITKCSATSPIVTSLPTHLKRNSWPTHFFKHHTTNPCFYCIPHRNISDKFTIIRDLFRFLKPSLISSMTSDEKVGFPIANHERIYKLILDSIPIASKHLIRTVLLKNPF